MKADELRKKVTAVKRLFSFFENVVITTHFHNCGTKARVTTNNAEIVEALSRQGVTGTQTKTDDIFIIEIKLES